MVGGIKYCGGCNPRFDRGKAFDTIKKRLEGKVDFLIAEEEIEYDFILVIGGCTKCCASYCQYKTKNDYILMWDENHIEKIIRKIQEIGGMELGLEGNL